MIQSAPSSTVSGFLNGWVGRASAHVSLHQDGDRVTLSGRAGDVSMFVHRTPTSITGSLNGMRGSWPVSVFVHGQEGNRSYNGWVGREAVSLHENGPRLTGWVGSRFVNGAMESRNGQLRFEGRAGFDFDGRVDLWGSQSPVEPAAHLDGLIPLFALAGA